MSYKNPLARQRGALCSAPTSSLDYYESPISLWGSGLCFVIRMCFSFTKLSRNVQFFRNSFRNYSKSVEDFELFRDHFIIITSNDHGIAVNCHLLTRKNDLTWKVFDVITFYARKKLQNPHTITWNYRVISLNYYVLKWKLSKKNLKPYNKSCWFLRES